MANHSSQIKKISECFIRPKHDDQVDQSKRQPYHLVHADLCFLASHYLQKGLLFTKPPNFNIQAFLDKLKLAIALSLDHYYPLAGRLVTVKCDDDEEEEEEEGEGSCWMYLDSNKAPGARFIHSVCSVATVADVVAASEPVTILIIRGLFEMGEGYFVNYDGHTRPLLCVQVTELIDGIFMGFTMNHSVVDGSTFWNFINSLSEVFNTMDGTNKGNLTISQVPVINPIFADGCGPIIKFPCSKLNEFITQCRVGVDPNLRERIFYISSTSIAKLKAQANVNHHCDGSLLQISSFQSLVAFLWRSITRARTLSPDLVTTCTLVADARARFDPPLSFTHFGNLILPIQVSSKVGEISENGLDWVAMLLHRAIRSVDQNIVRDRGKTLFETVFGSNPESASSVIGGETNVVIGGSVRFNMYGSEFGLGKAIAVRTGYSAKTDGKVTANPGCEGDGSVELEISLSPQAMNALEQDQEFTSFVSKN